MGCVVLFCFVFFPETNLHCDIYSYPLLSTEQNKWIQTNGISWLQGMNAYSLLILRKYQDWKKMNIGSLEFKKKKNIRKDQVSERAL